MSVVLAILVTLLYPFEFIYRWWVGMFIALFSDYTVFTFGVAGVSIGLAVQAFWVGFAAFFVLYSFMRMIEHASNAVALIANAIVSRPPPQ